MMLSERQRKFSGLLAAQFSWMMGQGMEWTLGDAWRSTDVLMCPDCGSDVTYQELLVYNGRSKVRSSEHNNRCAIDLVMYANGRASIVGKDYRAMGEHWESLGGTWGGRFGLEPHEYETAVGWDPGHLELK